MVSSRSAPIGLQRGIVRLLPHQPVWKTLFAAEAERIRGALGERALAIEHVGSTAVAGLLAKPIIDLMVGIADIDDADVEIRSLETIGYERRPNGDLPGRLYLVLGSGEVRRFHLSLSELESDFWRGHLRFRDRLRTDPSVAAAYARLKQELAAQYPDDRLSYTAGKEEFITNPSSRSASVLSRSNRTALTACGKSGFPFQTNCGHAGCQVRGWPRDDTPSPTQ